MLLKLAILLPPPSQETSIDSHLTSPSISVRHNTADAAALLSSMGEGDGEVEEEGHEVTTLDDELITKVCV